MSTRLQQNSLCLSALSMACDLCEGLQCEELVLIMQLKAHSPVALARQKQGALALLLATLVGADVHVLL
jgi:hypothetical protein